MVERRSGGGGRTEVVGIVCGDVVVAVELVFVVAGAGAPGVKL